MIINIFFHLFLIPYYYQFIILLYYYSILLPIILRRTPQNKKCHHLVTHLPHLQLPAVCGVMNRDGNQLDEASFVPFAASFVVL